ncbi:MAG TPA: hypothetical protein VIV40_38470 [Kofleriaceae bacterium]
MSDATRPALNRAWYLALLAPLALCGLGVLAFLRLADNIDHMPRLVVPGESTLTLEARDYRVFAESESTVDGVAYANDHFSVRCAIEANGKPLELATPTSRITYQLGGYAGRAIFVFTMPAAGTAKLACETDDGKAVLAVGTGIGTSIVAAVLTLVFGVIGTIAAFVIVFLLWRRGLQRSARA